MNRELSGHASQDALRKIAVLSAAAVGLWLVLSGPAYWLGGTAGLEGLTYAALLCLVPGWLVVYVTSRYPEAGTQATAVLLGTGLRMAFVLIGTIMLQGSRPDLGFREFVVWLICFYLAFLGLETAMLVKRTPE